MSSTFHILPLRFRAYLRHPRVRAAWISFFWGAVLFYFLFCALILVTRWILLPQVDRYKDDIADFLSDTLHAEVSIGQISPQWDSFWPHISLRNVVIQRPDPRSTDPHILHLPQVEASLYWRSILGQPIFRKLEVSDAEITVRRVGERVYDIAGFIFDLNRRSDESTRNFNAADWLLRQGRIDVTSCTVSYVDLTAKPRARTTSFENINFTFENRVNDYQMGIQGELDARHENRIDIRARFNAPLFGDRSWKTWAGTLFLAADNLDVARLTRPILAARQILKSGRGSTRTWLEFENGKPLSLTSYLGLSDVVLNFAKDSEALRVKTLSTKLSETFSNGAIQAKAENLTFELIDGTKASDLELSTSIVLEADPQGAQQRSGFRLTRLDVQTLRKLLPSIPFPQAAAEQIRQHDAHGDISDFEVSWLGAPTQAQDWRIKTAFSGLTIEHASDTAPKVFITGFNNLTGSAEITEKNGQIQFSTTNGSVTLPGVFENPRLSLSTLTGGIGWQLTYSKDLKRDIVSIDFKDITVANDDVEATVSGHWRQNETAAGYIDLEGSIVRARAEQAWRYMPLVIPENVRNWLEGGLVSGLAHNGRFELRGDLVKYPWVGPYQNQGHFLVTARLQDAALDYVPSMKRLANGQFERGSTWPVLSSINGELTFEGASMTVLADSAVTGGARITQARAEIPDLSAHENTRLIINGTAQASLQQFFDYVEASPVTDYVSGAFTGTKAKGAGKLDLSLDIPLLQAKNTKVSGSISMRDADIEMGWPKPPLTDVEGIVHFSEKGAQASNLHARPFGSGDTSVSVHTTAAGAIVINATGSTDVSNLSWFAQNPYFTPVVEQMSGNVPFVASVMIKKGQGVTVSARSSMQGVAINLPEPLKKSAQETWNTSFSFTPATIRNNKGFVIKTASGSRFDVLLQLPTDGSKLAALGNIAVGRRAEMPEHGISVAVNVDSLKLLDWQPFVQKMLVASKKTGSVVGQSTGSPQGILSEIEVAADKLLLEDGVIHNSRSRFQFDAQGNVDISLSSDEVLGKLRYETAGRGSVTGSFDRLHLSNKSVTTLKRFLSGEAVDVAIQARPTVLPSLDLVAEELVYDDKKIGRLVLQAEASGTSDEETLRIRNFAIFSDVSALTGTGSWTQGKKLTGTHPGQTDFQLQFTTKNLGRTLTDLGFQDVIEDCEGTARAHLKFQGIPWSPKLDTLTGSYSVDFRKGNFAKVDTGAGGLVLSFLSLQSLFKRLTLDFSDFKGGFAFDSFAGSSLITDGVLSSDNTKIVGTHGTILLSGNLNIAQGNIDSRVIVLPEINAANASLALAFVNPAVGIGSFLAQLLLRAPLSHLFKVEYAVTGPWDDPLVTKISSDNTPKERIPSQ